MACWAGARMGTNSPPGPAAAATHGPRARGAIPRTPQFSFEEPCLYLHNSTQNYLSLLIRYLHAALTCLRRTLNMAALLRMCYVLNVHER